MAHNTRVRAADDCIGAFGVELGQDLLDELRVTWLRVVSRTGPVGSVSVANALDRVLARKQLANQGF